MNDYKKLKKNPFIDKRLCIKYIKNKFQEELDNTKGNKGINYKEFLASEEEQRKGWVINMKKYYEQKNIKEEQINRDIFRLYYGSINIFKPSVAKWICDKYKPFSVLDFSSGWGSRMLGCTASGCQYIGIDNNINLRKGYNEIITELELKNVEIIFNDCMNIDYSKYTYDMVLTSPPYYNLEIYSHTEKRSKEEWNKFYKEIFTKVFEHLQPKGHMIINVNQEIYEKNLLPLFGEPLEKIEYPKSYRRNQKHNPEYIYIFKK
jgi:hypothetical protein